MYKRQVVFVEVVVVVVVVVVDDEKLFAGFVAGVRSSSSDANSLSTSLRNDGRVAALADEPAAAVGREAAVDVCDDAAGEAVLLVVTGERGATAETRVVVSRENSSSNASSVASAVPGAGLLLPLLLLAPSAAAGFFTDGRGLAAPRLPSKLSMSLSSTRVVYTVHFNCIF